MDSVIESTDAKGNVLRGKGYCTQHKATNVYLKSVTIVSFIISVAVAMYSTLDYILVSQWSGGVIKCLLGLLHSPSYL